MADIHFSSESSDALTGLYLSLANIEQAAKHAATRLLREEGSFDLDAMLDGIQRKADAIRVIRQSLAH